MINNILTIGTILGGVLLSSAVFAGNNKWEDLFTEKLSERQKITDAKILKIGDEYEISPKVKNIVMGLSWEPKDSNTSLDYDLSLFAYYTPNKFTSFGNRKQKLLQIVDYENLFISHADFPSGAIRHRGDDINGRVKRVGDDNEQINIYLDQIKNGFGSFRKVKDMVATISSSDGDGFDLAKEAFFRITEVKVGTWDQESRELARFYLDGLDETKGVIIGHLYFNKERDRWIFKAEGKDVEKVKKNQTVAPKDMEPTIKELVRASR